MVDSEIIWGETGYEIEDSLRVTDGDTGEADELSVDYFCQWPNYKSELLGIGIEKSALWPGISEFYVRTLSARREGSSRCIVSIAAAGMSGGFSERRRRTISAFGQVVSIGPIEKIIIVTTLDETAVDPETGDPVAVTRRETKLDALGETEYKTLVTPSGSGERWNIAEAGIRLVDVYFSKTRPSMVEVKLPFTPLDAPLVPVDPWLGYEEALRGNHPFGWVLDDRQIEDVVSGQLYRVTDTIGHYLERVPD